MYSSLPFLVSTILNLLLIRKPFPASFYPPDTDEKMAALQSFFQQAGNFGVTLPRMNKVIEALAAEGKTSIGVYGTCWGGKLSATLAATTNTNLKACAAVHPAYVVSLGSPLIYSLT